ncbi:glycosyltransferase family protein [Oleidesulfovibrio sp.]|uniref:glycosyltransferase family protein n=1 Tax=Oleidesulfovibrio sp. TaxID=2909707 RepID=UPI003A8C0F90
MYKIFWLGSPFFAPSITTSECTVVQHDFKQHETFSWDDIVLHAGFTPDIVVVADKSRPPFVRGIESFPCLTVFLCIDSHIHSWYPRYAQGFDLCLVSLRDHLKLFQNMRLEDDHILWMPAFAKDHDQPLPAEPLWDVLFVGTVNKEITPKRLIFLEHLRTILGDRLHITQGDYRTLYPKGKVILNYCEHGDLNFRVFEALGCGGCLVTPAIANGQQELFCDRKHFLTYQPDNAEDAARKALTLLNTPQLRATLAAQGNAEINKAHRASHRAAAFLEALKKIDIKKTVDERCAKAASIHQQYLRFLYLLHAESSEAPAARALYLAEAKRYS